MNIIRNIYRVVRTLLFSAIILVAVVYLILYILLSTPPLQHKIKEIVQNEITKLLGGEVRIDDLSIRPFNELTIAGLEASAPDGECWLKVERIGAGVNMWRLVSSGEIEITYGEIIGLDARIEQREEDGPLNIQYVIDALAPKDKNKPPTKFDLKLRNIVLRRCGARFDRSWQPDNGDPGKTDFNHLVLDDLKADIAFPRLSNEDFNIDLRRMAFNLSGGLVLKKLAFRAHVTPRSISVEDLVVGLPSTELRPSDVSISFEGFGDILNSLKTGDHKINIVDNEINPSDFGWIMPVLRNFDFPLTLTLESSGNVNCVNLTRLSVRESDNLAVDVSGNVGGLDNPGSLTFAVDNLMVHAGRQFVGKVLSYTPSVGERVRHILGNCGDITLKATGEGNLAGHNFQTDCEVITSCGSVTVIGGVGGLENGRGSFNGELTADGVDISGLLGGGAIGKVSGEVSLAGELHGRDADGEANAYLSQLEFNGRECGGIAVETLKSGNTFGADVVVDNEMANMGLKLSGEKSGGVYSLDVDCDVRHFVPSMLGMMAKYDGYVLSGQIKSALWGSNPDDMTGEVNLDDMVFSGRDKSISLDCLNLRLSDVDGMRTISLNSDWIDGEVSGRFKFKEIPLAVKGILSSAFPSMFPSPGPDGGSQADVEFAFLVKPDNDAIEFFNLPFRLLVPVPIGGMIDGQTGSASLSVDVPFIQQGKNKLVRDSRVNMNINGAKGMLGLELASTFPAKKGDLALDLKVWGEDENIYADLGWKSPDNDNFKGLLSLGAKISKDELTSHPRVNVDITPSIFDIGPARWKIDKGSITYAEKILKVDNFRLWHDNQFVAIDGVASSSPSDSLSVRLADIDLDYVFDLLKINYVTFGGSATGEVVGKSVFSGSPQGWTDNLSVKRLSYNGEVLGEANLKSHWDNEQKEVVICADISHAGKRRALIDGGIWVTRDSLSFGIEADRVPVDFLKPFMSAFTSDVKGKASGNAKLFGTFSDIDLVGRLYADSIAMKLDFTNTWYHGSDSVILDPGHIVIPSFRLYDRHGNSALLTGDLTHRYFHEPRFTFRVSDARHLLCYDTNSRMNPDWYGTLYGNGSAIVRGWPGVVNISVDMDITDNSAFTFVLNDTQAAEDYHFLTFSDRRKEEAERQMRDTVPDILSAFRKRMEIQNATPSRFSIDIRATVGPSSLMTLVMDPVAGDKITARGNGAIQMEYESDSEELLMFGKYSLDEGNYNFSLQDLILRDFTIRSGSSISFNGDPMNANLDITASYRVNTNLSDLDKSFSTDKDLARTNVPVDAMLMVTGEMQHPDITFDIELPTLTQDVERKVKSIVSTDDMMSRQIIYLLALNRFYTPEYMGSSSNGGELAAVASTTLSSQLSNMIGQLTDKFTLSPSFRSDKGDFSDLEVDVALSSRLLDNRLLVNGNFGYRDRNTSSTTFVGDFDIEYLLNRRGNLRLKAYNHFNDQNYYLREALTTQGIGVVYRRDFDNLFNLLRRRKKKKPHGLGSSGEQGDTTVAPYEDSVPVGNRLPDARE